MTILKMCGRVGSVPTEINGVVSHDTSSVPNWVSVVHPQVEESQLTFTILSAGPTTTSSIIQSHFPSLLVLILYHLVSFCLVLYRLVSSCVILYHLVIVLYRLVSS